MATACVHHAPPVVGEPDLPLEVVREEPFGRGVASQTGADLLASIPIDGDSDLAIALRGWQQRRTGPMPLDDAALAEIDGLVAQGAGLQPRNDADAALTLMIDALRRFRMMATRQVPVDEDPATTVLIARRLQDSARYGEAAAIAELDAYAAGPVTAASVASGRKWLLDDRAPVRARALTLLDTHWARPTLQREERSILQSIWRSHLPYRFSASRLLYDDAVARGRAGSRYLDGLASMGCAAGNGRCLWNRNLAVGLQRYFRRRSGGAPRNASERIDAVAAACLPFDGRFHLVRGCVVSEPSAAGCFRVACSWPEAVDVRVHMRALAPVR